jgi:hypothetical protein
VDRTNRARQGNSTRLNDRIAIVTGAPIPIDGGDSAV